jgi:exonuclease VII large subunit
MTPELRALIKRRADEKFRLPAAVAEFNSQEEFDQHALSCEIQQQRRETYISAQEEVYEKIEEIRKAVEQRISEMEQALKQLPKDQIERVKGNLSSCDKILSIIDKHLKA